MQKIAVTALLSSVLTLCAVYLLATPPAEPSYKTLLENARVEVTERIIAPGGERVPFIRETGQVIVFLNDTKYERIDATTGEKIVRSRKAGEVLWHNKGENAPKLVNVDSKPFRSLVIAVK